jgi:hypothetical protein
VGVTFSEEDVVEALVGTGSGSGGASGAVAWGVEVVLDADGGVFDLSVFFWPANGTIEGSCGGAVDSFAHLLEVAAGKVAEAFVDFCRTVPFLTVSILSPAVDSETTFFGLPLFFTTSVDIFVGLQITKSSLHSQSDHPILSPIISRVVRKGDAT